MTNLNFNKRRFLRTIIFFVILTTIWTTLCIATDEFTDKDKGFVSGLGFLLLFSLSIYFGQELKHLTLLVYLSLLTITTFLVASFVLGPLIGLTTNSWILYAVVNSLLVPIVMTVFLDKIVGIEFKLATGIATCVFVLISYFILDKFNNRLYLDYDFNPRLTMFNVFQLMLIIPLTVGMTLKKGSTQLIRERCA